MSRFGVLKIGADIRPPCPCEHRNPTKLWKWHTLVQHQNYAVTINLLFVLRSPWPFHKIHTISSTGRGNLWTSPLGTSRLTRWTNGCNAVTWWLGPFDKRSHVISQILLGTGLCTHMCHRNQPNLGKHAIHWHWYKNWCFALYSPATGLNWWEQETRCLLQQSYRIWFEVFTSNTT